MQAADELAVRVTRFGLHSKQSVSVTRQRRIPMFLTFTTLCYVMASPTTIKLEALPQVWLRWRLGQHQCAVADALLPGPGRDSP